MIFEYELFCSESVPSGQKPVKINNKDTTSLSIHVLPASLSLTLNRYLPTRIIDLVRMQNCPKNHNFLPLIYTLSYQAHTYVSGDKHFQFFERFCFSSKWMISQEKVNIDDDFQFLIYEEILQKLFWSSSFAKHNAYKSCYEIFF